ncbi:MAG: hypothetical protein ACYDBQ_09825 [Thermoplasmatota archaeon]
MRGLAFALLVFAAGCVSLPSHPALAPAPSWSAGDAWHYSGTVHETENSTSRGSADSYDKVIAITEDEQVLAVSNVAGHSFAALLVHESGDGHTSQSLQLAREDDMAMLGATFSVGPCAAGDFCLPPLHARPSTTAPLSGFPFPLTPGAWANASEGASERTLHVVGWDAEKVGSATVAAVQVHEEVVTGNNGNPNYSYSSSDRNDGWYAPSVQNFVVNRGTFSSAEDGGGSSSYRYAGSGQLDIRLARYDSERVPDMGTLAAALYPSATQLPDQAGGAAQVTIDPHASNVMNGTAIRFTASVSGAPQNYTLHWRLQRVLPGGATHEEGTGTGPTFTAANPSGGLFALTVTALDGQTQASLGYATTRFSVNVALTGSFACQAGVSPSVAPQALCPAVPFSLPGGLFNVRAEVNYPAGEATAPCPTLTLSQDGRVISSAAAWPNLPAAVTAPSQSDVPSGWVLQWSPSVGTTGAHPYTITATVVDATDQPATAPGC